MYPSSNGHMTQQLRHNSQIKISVYMSFINKSIIGKSLLDSMGDTPKILKGLIGSELLSNAQ